MLMVHKVEKKNGEIVENFYFPTVRGVIRRQLAKHTTRHLDVYVSYICKRRRCQYDTAACKTCKNCDYKMKY